MPPVNFDKYGVVGEALDKLHAEQVSRPPQGSPVAIAPDGTYSLKTAPRPAAGREYQGGCRALQPAKGQAGQETQGC